MINFYKTQDEAKKEKNTRKLPARHLSGRMKSKCKQRVEDNSTNRCGEPFIFPS